MPHSEGKRNDPRQEDVAKKTGTTRFPSSKNDQPVAKPARGWVWHSTLASFAAGQVSVLAFVESFVAVVLYWWFAIRYDTHLHIVGSVFIAPLLLLRSSESMQTGVRWFLKDWSGLWGYDQWPTRKKTRWIGVVGLFSFLPAYSFTHWLSLRWLSGPEGWLLIAWATAIGALVVLVTVALVFAVTFAVTYPVVLAAALAAVTAVAATGVSVAATASAAAVAITVGIAFRFAFAGVGAAAFAAADAGASKIAGGVAGGFAFAAVGPIVGFGIVMRSLVFRLAATLRYILAGAKRLPKNWRENNFVVDSALPAELLPGIRNSNPLYSWEGLANRKVKGRSLWVGLPFFGLFLFLPAILYRLNIKATAWFWWPLAYLFSPAPVMDTEGQQKQELCWPITNPSQRACMLVAAVLTLSALVLPNLNLAETSERLQLPALPLVLKVLLGLDWARYAPWHYAQWVVAAASLLMLRLAGEARSHSVNGNWEAYRRDSPWDIHIMVGLKRIRLLATIAWLGMGLGALALHEQARLSQVPVPEKWFDAWQNFYRRPGWPRDDSQPTDSPILEDAAHQSIIHAYFHPPSQSRTVLVQHGLRYNSSKAIIAKPQRPSTRPALRAPVVPLCSVRRSAPVRHFTTYHAVTTQPMA